MSSLPEAVNTAWENREGPIVFATVDGQQMPNAIYASCVIKLNESQWVVADNFFHKTRANIQAGSKATLLFITKERKSFQLKGSVDYQTAGPIFDDMRVWLDEHKPGLPGIAVAVLTVEEIYSGAEKLL